MIEIEFHEVPYIEIWEAEKGIVDRGTPCPLSLVNKWAIGSCHMSSCRFYHMGNGPVSTLLP